MSRLVGLVLFAALSLGLPGCGGGKITKANADKIKNGMTEKEVTDILGPPTESADASLPDMGAMPGGDVAGMPKMPKGAKQAVWKSGSKVIAVSFVDGKVMSKTVSGF
jgi:hypothetical protein